MPYLYSWVFFLGTLDCLLSYYICIHDPCNTERTSTYVYVPFVLFLLKKKSSSKRCLANQRSSPRTYSGEVCKFGSVSSHDADKMHFLGSFLPRNNYIFYWNNIVFWYQIVARNFPIKQYYILLDYRFLPRC